MRVFTTLLLDSLQLLRARVLFWITLWISVFAAVLYLSIGFTPEGISLAFGALTFKNPMLQQGSQGAELLYLGIYSDIVVGVWLSWAAIILALISCAPIYPDFMSEGSIGIPLSKPVSRLALFFYKYIGSLLFVVLQVTLFSLIVFLAIRLRIGTWNPGVFWAIPLVTLMFSYIYSVVVLVSVKTRSMLAALLAGFFVWGAAFIIQKTEDGLYVASNKDAAAILPGMMPNDEAAASQWEKWHKVSVMVMAALPKTGETTKLMDRLMKTSGDDSENKKSLVSAMSSSGGASSEALAKVVTRHSPLYVIGTSLLFEAVMLGMASWIFCRRDY